MPQMSRECQHTHIHVYTHIHIHGIHVHTCTYIYIYIYIYIIYIFFSIKNKTSFVILLDFVIDKKKYHRESNENELTKKCKAL